MSWPDHLLTLDEFEELPEDDSRRYELQEGVLHVTPKAASLHQRVIKRLTDVLDRQLPADWEAVPDVEVVLEHQWPPTLRIPDVVIAPTGVIDENPNRLTAQDVAVAIEVVSPGSHRTDRLVKRHEYAKAGIPGYWVLEIDSTVTLSAGRLVDSAYDSHFEGGGEFKAASPFALTIDLPSLASRRGGPGPDA